MEEPRGLQSKGLQRVGHSFGEGHNLLEFKGFPVAQLVKNPPAMLETRFDPWDGHGVYGPWSRKESVKSQIRLTVTSLGFKSKDQNQAPCY